MQFKRFYKREEISAVPAPDIEQFAAFPSDCQLFELNSKDRMVPEIVPAARYLVEYLAEIICHI
jgi:hypothetical protein